MTVRETQLTPEQKSQESAIQYQEEKNFASRLAQSMDLPSTLTGEIDNSIKKSLEPPKEEEEGEEVENEEEQEEVTEEEQEEPKAEETEQDSEEEEEDLIPKSKVQKRFDELTAQIKKLQQAQEAKDREVKETAQKDSQLEQLEKMSAEELKTLKRQIRVEQIKASSDEAKLSQLLDLEDKVERTLQTAPQRFQNTQITRFENAVRETAESMDGFEKVKGDIFNHAKAIFESAPELQGSVYGQERAWKLAVEHFNALRKVTEGKSDTTELKRQVNTLKKKISVDSTSKKAVTVADSESKLFRKALSGDDSDKKNFLRRRINTDALVSDDELGGINRRR